MLNVGVTPALGKEQVGPGVFEILIQYVKGLIQHLVGGSAVPIFRVVDFFQRQHIEVERFDLSRQIWWLSDYAEAVRWDSRL